MIGGVFFGADEGVGFGVGVTLFEGDGFGVGAAEVVGFTDAEGEDGDCFLFLSVVATGGDTALLSSRFCTK
jgi:hypothetical protein